MELPAFRLLGEGGASRAFKHAVPYSPVPYSMPQFSPCLPWGGCLPTQPAQDPHQPGEMLPIGLSACSEAVSAREVNSQRMHKGHTLGQVPLPSVPQCLHLSDGITSAK